MIRFIEKLTSTVNRNLKEASYAFRMYGAIVLFAILVLGFSGIGTVYPLVRAKSALLKETEVLRGSLTSNLANLQRADGDLNNSRLLLGYLDRYLPQGTNVQSYMSEFIQSVSDQGFFVKTFSQNTYKSVQGQIEINIVLEGNAYPTNLIENIEILKRVTQVKRADIDYVGQGGYDISLVVTIYTLIT